MSRAPLIEPRSEIDRTTVGRLRTRCFELSLLWIERAERLLLDPATPARELAAIGRILLERTVPTVQRVRHEVVSGQLAPSKDEAQAVEAEVTISPDAQDRAADEFLRRIGSAPTTNGMAH